MFIDCPHCNKPIRVTMTFTDSITTNDTDPNWIELLKHAKPQSEKERVFISDLKAMHEKYGRKTRISDKQRTWLIKIASQI